MAILNGKTYALIIPILFFAALYFLGSIITPFFIAALLAYLSDPLVHRLMRYKFSRGSAVTVVFFAVFVSITIFILLLIPLLHKQIIKLDPATE